MSISKEQKILNIKIQIESNTRIISNLCNENNRLMNSLTNLGLFSFITPEKKLIYDKQLASNNWMYYSNNKYAVIFDDNIIYSDCINIQEAQDLLFELKSESDLKNLRIINMYELSKQIQQL